MRNVTLAVGDFACHVYNMDMCIGVGPRHTLGLGIIACGALFTAVAVILSQAVRR